MEVPTANMQLSLRIQKGEKQNLIKMYFVSATKFV